MNIEKCMKCLYVRGNGTACSFWGKRIWPDSDKQKSSCNAFKALTNGDKIRKMSDEELAEYMSINHVCDFCPAQSNTCHNENGILNIEQCRKCWLDWLNEEEK